MNEQQYRAFQERMNAMTTIIRINNPEKYEELVRLAAYWAPETKAMNYSRWVQKNYEIDLNDIVSLTVYSILMNISIEELRAKIMMDFKTNTR